MYDPPHSELLERIGAALLAVLIVVASCARDGRLRVDDDLALATTVESRLNVDSQLRPFGLTVAAHEGTVVLRGQVEDDLDRQRARAISRETPEVIEVIDLLQVATPPYEVDSPFRDAWVATRVKARLVADEGLDASGISVDAHEGVVVLSGRVATATDRQGAEVLARRVRGVTDVVNRVEVAPRG